VDEVARAPIPQQDLCVIPVSADLAVRRASELCSMAGAGRDGSSRLGALAGGALACRAGRIAWVGPDRDFDRAVALIPSARVLDAAGCTVTPGLIDCHTHLVFAGDRSGEYARLCQGASYREIAAAGGGIAATVEATRAASEDSLVALALPRLSRLLSFGVTTAEVKSGYGLSTEAELKLLRSVARLGASQPIELVPTLLCAHAVPREYASRREAYVALCTEEIIPEVARQRLARFCDAFVEDGAFTPGEGRAILEAAARHGLSLRVHADQLSPSGGSRLAAELGAATADHLEAIDGQGIAALAAAGTSGVLLPTSTLLLKQPRFAPGRALWEAGVNVALATNLNPGSAMTENASLALGLACLSSGLTPAEALFAFTRGAALALGLGETLGALAPGLEADIAIHACASHRHLAYHFAVPHVRTVVKRGAVVFEAPIPLCP
jgi:imidazolonepropionase